MNKRELIKAYKIELEEIEVQESLANRTINAITRRKSVLIKALGDLGDDSSALPKKRKRKIFSNHEMLNIKASITKKAPARA